MKVYCEKCGEVIAEALPAVAEKLLAEHEQLAHKTPTTAEQDWEAMASAKYLYDVVPPEALKGNLITSDELLDKVFTVIAFDFKESTYKEDEEYLSATIVVDKSAYLWNTGAARLLTAFRALKKEYLPVRVQVEKIKLSTGRRVYRIKERPGSKTTEVEK